jgi:hypothetical protein
VLVEDTGVAANVAEGVPAIGAAPDGGGPPAAQAAATMLLIAATRGSLVPSKRVSTTQWLMRYEVRASFVQVDTSEERWQRT